jgi:hypothetical protein
LKTIAGISRSAHLDFNFKVPIFCADSYTRPVLSISVSRSWIPGTYSRFMADDFCSAATAQSLGIVRGAAWWYVNWSGRFSANILDSVFGYLGPRITPAATLIILILWFGALICVAVSTFRLLVDRPSISVCVLTAAVLLFVVVENHS